MIDRIYSQVGNSVIPDLPTFIARFTSVEYSKIAHVARILTL